MIAKRIMSPQGGSGYKRLAGYVLNVQQEHQGADPASWTRLNAYILDAAHGGEKVAWARVTNCQTDDPGWAVKEILATQAHNRRSRTDKSYHLVVSFPEGERPTRGQIEDIEDSLCAALGFAEHQRVSAVHQNTDNWHVHIAINKVHPRTFRNIEPFRDRYRLQEACAELEIRHGLTREPHTVEPWRDAAEKGRGTASIRGKAADFEAQQCAQSFLRWTRERAAAALLETRDSGKGWPELHRVAALYDLEFKPRGAGLAIGHRRDGRLHVKASDVDRGLSLRALTEALGPYEPPKAASNETLEVSYARPAVTGSLYDRFKQERDAVLAAREAARRALHERHLAYADKLKAYYRHRLREERRSLLQGFLKRDAVRHVVEQRAQDHAVRIRREAEERRKLRARYPIPNWQGFLETEAAQGNETALMVLRSREQRRSRIEAQLFGATDAAEAQAVIRRDLRPLVRRDGRLIYRVADGGVVSDERHNVRVSQVTTGAAFLALSLARERFGARPLVVRGTDDFRTQVATLAGIKGLDVAFADRVLERQRISAREEHMRGVDRDRVGVLSIYTKLYQTRDDQDHGR